MCNGVYVPALACDSLAQALLEAQIFLSGQNRQGNTKTREKNWEINFLVSVPTENVNRKIKFSYRSTNFSVGTPFPLSVLLSTGKF